jgi:hypothetical protein
MVNQRISMIRQISLIRKLGQAMGRSFSIFSMSIAMNLVYADPTTIETTNLDPTTCFQDSAQICYQPTIHRGRTVTGIYEPERFKPLVEISSPSEFHQAWIDNPLYILASLSHAAYLNENEISAMIHSLSGEFHYFDVSGQQGYLASWTDKAILVFRGTDEPMNIFDNLKAGKKPFLGAKVHQGFSDAALDIWFGGSIESHLKKHTSKLINFENVFITGHSLGAGMAVIASLIYPFKHVITFGEPRVGDQLVNAFNMNTTHIRVVNGNDNVTLIPLESMGYKHHGKEIAIRDPHSISQHVSLTGINVDHSIINYALNLWDHPIEIDL